MDWTNVLVTLAVSLPLWAILAALLLRRWARNDTILHATAKPVGRAWGLIVLCAMWLRVHLYTIWGNNFTAILLTTKFKERRRAHQMPTERDALLQMQGAVLRLREMGWKPVAYAPRDGTPFLGIELFSTGVHHCYYEGPGFWSAGHGDIYPARPILCKRIDDNEGSGTA